MYNYCILKEKNIASNAVITVENKLGDGYNYISKLWM